jgi:hypothetical protein
MVGEHRDLRWSFIADGFQLASSLLRQPAMATTVMTTSISSVLIRLIFRNYADAAPSP